MINFKGGFWSLLVIFISFATVPVFGQLDPCGDGLHTVIDDPRRDVTFRYSDFTLCDLDLVDGWYRFLLNGSNAVIPTTCVQPGQCSTQAPVWLDLSGPLPNKGQEVETRGCSSWGGGDGEEVFCCFYPYSATLRNCGDFLIYRLGSTLACNIAYCAQEVIKTTTATTTPSTTTLSTTTSTTTATTTTTTTETHSTTSETTPSLFSTSSSARPTDELDPDFDSELDPKVETFDPEVDIDDPDVEKIYKSDEAASTSPSGRPSVQVFVREGEVYINCSYSRSSYGQNAVVRWYEQVIEDEELLPLLVEASVLKLGVDVRIGQKVACSISSSTTKTNEKDVSEPLFLGLRIKEKSLKIAEDGSVSRLTIVTSVPVLCPDDSQSDECSLLVSLMVFDTAGNYLSRLRFSQCNIRLTAADCVGAVCSEIPLDLTLYPLVQYIPKVKEAMLIGGITYTGQGTWDQQALEAKLVIEDIKFRHCHMYSDPHVISLDGKIYNIFRRGTFTMLNSTQQDILVNVRISTCRNEPNTGFCICGVIVQDGLDIVAVDGCAGQGVKVTYPNGYISEDVRVFRSHGGKTFTIIFLSGTRLRVYIEDYGMSLTLSLVVHDPEGTTGICGNGDGIPDNDFLKNGGGFPRGSNDILQALDFVESYRLISGQSLFDKSADYSDSDSEPELFQGSIRCDCSPLSAGENCRVTSLWDEVIPAVLQSEDATVLPFKPDDTENPGDYLESSQGDSAARKKRSLEDNTNDSTLLDNNHNPNQKTIYKLNAPIQIQSQILFSSALDQGQDETNNKQGQDQIQDRKGQGQVSDRGTSADYIVSRPELYYFLFDHRISTQAFFPRWPGPGGVTEVQASDACARILFGAPVTLTCADYNLIGPIISTAFDFCKEDIQIKGNISWTKYSTRILEAACDIASLEQAQNFTRGNGNAPVFPKALVLALSCPQGCGRRGECTTDQGCQCEPGFTGPTCSEIDIPDVEKRDQEESIRSNQDVPVIPVAIRSTRPVTDLTTSKSTTSPATATSVTTTTTLPTTTTATTKRFNTIKTTSTTTSTTTSVTTPRTQSTTSSTPSTPTTTTMTPTTSTRTTAETTTSSTPHFEGGTATTFQTSTFQTSTYPKSENPKPLPLVTEKPQRLANLPGAESSAQFEACDLSLERCTMITFAGTYLQKTLSCKISPVKITSSNIIELDSSVTTSSIISPEGQFLCVLPYYSYLRQIFGRVPEFHSLKLEAVDTRNNALALKYLTIFDSTCLVCEHQGQLGCRVKDDFCYIQNSCYASESLKEFDHCLQCVPRLTQKYWSPRQDNEAPVLYAQKSVFVFNGQDARLAITANDPEGSRVILSVDRKDAFISQSGQFLWRAIGNDASERTRVERFTITAKDVCNATTALRLVIQTLPCSCFNGGSCINARFVEDSQTEVTYDCQCKPGFSGSLCEENSDECDPNPCERGTCLDLVNGFKCLCEYGIEGERCERTKDLCSNNPCFRGVTCTAVGSDVMCGPCPEGFTGNGFTCVETSPCASSPCFPGSPCSNLPGTEKGYKCGPCPRYFYGDGVSCKRQAISACADEVCSSVSKCTETQQPPGYTCGSCPKGYSGDGQTCTPDCNIECPQRQTCVKPNVCGCRSGYTGDNCDTPTCSPVCQNGGACIRPNQCRCFSGYKGAYCQMSACDNPCQNGGRCIGTNRCLCPYGYSGTNCQFCTYFDDNNLACRHPCLNGGRCVGPNICECKRGYDGKHCETPVCHPPCLNGGSCVSPDRCQCKSGYRGSQCETALCYPPCQHGGVCRRFNTCKCPYGYAGRKCHIPVCRPFCMNGGRCVGPNRCLCNSGWTGHRCDQPLCHFPCENGGVCITPDVCACPRQFTGPICQNRVGQRQHRYWRSYYANYYR